MSCWELIGIEPTADLTAIKRAYAAELKKNKPDENPEGFKALHAAYKSAMQYAKQLSLSSRADADADADEAAQSPAGEAAGGEMMGSAEPQTPPDSRDDDSVLSGQVEIPAREYYPEFPRSYQDESQQSVAISHKVNDGCQGENEAYRAELEAIANSDNSDELVFLQQQWEEITARVEEVTESVARINNLRSWYFLEGCEAFFDLQFKSEMSRFVFAQIANTFVNVGSKSGLRKGVLDYLDALFLWRDRRDMLEDEFGFEAVELVLSDEQGIEQSLKWTSPKFHKGELVYAGYYARLFSTLLDWVLFAFLTAWIFKVGSKYFGMSGSELGGELIAAAVAYMILVPLMEATPMQGTPGKILFGMKVVSPRGRRLNLLHAYLRMLLFSISTGLFKITIWINLIINDGRLLHDRLSGSIVVRR